MKKINITSETVTKFKQHLCKDEKSKATIDKYLRDVRAFMGFAQGDELGKTLVLNYKAVLEKRYSINSANSIIAALNTFFKYIGRHDCIIKQFKVQKKIFCPEDKELSKAEYIRLVKTAKRTGNERLSLILQTICGTGIRVSELEAITVEAVRRGEAIVSCKNKTRTVFIVRELQKKLLSYIKKRAIDSGSVFVTRTGKPIDRCNIWREMKSLCERAGVAPDKVFPHNLRHLFARIFYSLEKDIAKLADILGHSSINTTRIYIITTGAEHRRRMELMHLII